MKHRMLLVLVLTVLVSLSLCFAGVKGDEKAACCQKATKASMTKDAKMSDKCTDADKASCDMTKGTKASMKKSGGKAMDCCKDGEKASNTKGAKADKAAEGKGTN